VSGSPTDEAKRPFGLRTNRWHRGGTTIQFTEATRLVEFSDERQCIGYDDAMTWLEGNSSLFVSA
jgi:hypothetical protein